MADASRASDWLTLQRGGEEVLLAKVADRFTTRLTSPEAVQSLAAMFHAVAHRPVARGQLVEWQVAADQLEAQIASARSHPSVQFASHVYRLQVSPRTWVYLLDQITVQFAPTVSAAQGEAIARQYGLSPVGTLEGIPNCFVWAVTPAALENPIKIANRLMAHPEVLTAEPNVVVETAGLYRPRDPLFAQQWHLAGATGDNVKADAHISVDRAWDITRGSRSVVIAVTDDGFDLNHPDLQGMGKLVAPMDLKARDAVPLPTEAGENHGTACAGLAIGEENQTGIVGVAPGCGFMPIRTTGFLDDEAIEDLFLGAVKRGAAVISCSWSPAATYFPLSLRQRNALTQAATQGRNGKGCVIVFSAGNANRPVSGTIEEKNWPRNAVSGTTNWLSGFGVHPDVITVSACTSLNRKAAYSNWGQHVAIAAPSNNAPPNMALPEVGVVSTGPSISPNLPGRGMVTSDRTGKDGYGSDSFTNSFGGTSSSCPVVAGVAGLMLSVNPNLTAREVKQILQQTADKIVDPNPDPQLGLRYGTYDSQGHSQWFGYGRVNAYKAVLEAKRRLWQGRRYSRKVELKDESTTAIPDNRSEGVVRSRLCRDRGQVQDLAIQVKLEHDFLGDVQIWLQPPTGAEILLQGRTLGAQQVLTQRYTLKTTPTLIQVLGLEAAGNWNLRVCDRAPGHTGRLLGWSLTLALP